MTDKTRCESIFIHVKRFFSCCAVYLIYLVSAMGMRFGNLMPGIMSSAHLGTGVRPHNMPITNSLSDLQPPQMNPKAKI